MSDNQRAYFCCFLPLRLSNIYEWRDIEFGRLSRKNQKSIALLSLVKLKRDFQDLKFESCSLYSNQSTFNPLQKLVPCYTRIHYDRRITLHMLLNLSFWAVLSTGSGDEKEGPFTISEQSI